eukprot:6192756-Pleurochrysis_carterae.AAC.4
MAAESTAAAAMEEEDDEEEVNLHMMELNSPANLKRRLALRNDPGVIKALERWWLTAVSTMEMEKATDLGMHYKQVQACCDD